MATKLVVEVCKIDEMQPHANADRLEIAIIKGWQCIVPIGQFKTGDLVVYFPPDTLLPREQTDALGVTNYCTFYKDAPDMGRIKCTRLRGEPSFGLVAALPCSELADGDDMAVYYGAVKYEPPVRPQSGDAETPHPMFYKYTDIENLRNFPNIFEPGEMVVASEKLHGSNVRIGFVIEDGKIVRMAGSMEIQRKQPSDADMARNLYWHPWGMESVQSLMFMMQAYGVKSAILFGETYGAKVQKRGGIAFAYDTTPGILGFRAFDLMIDGKYADSSAFKEHCELQNVPVAPIVYEGPFDIEAIKAASVGNSTLADHIREGVVVRPVIERTHPKIGRVILKYVSDDYLLLAAKGKMPDFKDV